MLTHNTKLYKLIISWYEKLSHIKLTVKHLETIVDCYPQSDASDGMEQPASLFLVLYSILCPDLLFVSHEALPTMQQRLPMILFYMSSS